MRAIAIIKSMPEGITIMYTYCYRSGEIDFGTVVPEGALPLGKARSAKRLREIITVTARHAYDGKTLLVPGLPEAKTEDAAVAAYRYFRDVVSMRVAGQSGWPARAAVQPTT
ncbi:hypothetical protein AA105894_2572 [Asaia spathodeae NBRC 105894]|nr:hypothetical protein AA105894_2572 [Asaia spathodeae NBRC 105894]